MDKSSSPEMEINLQERFLSFWQTPLSVAQISLVGGTNSLTSQGLALTRKESFKSFPYSCMQTKYALPACVYFWREIICLERSRISCTRITRLFEWQMCLCLSDATVTVAIIFLWSYRLIFWCHHTFCGQTTCRDKLGPFLRASAIVAVKCAGNSLPILRQIIGSCQQCGKRITINQQAPTQITRLGVWGYPQCDSMDHPQNCWNMDSMFRPSSTCRIPDFTAAETLAARSSNEMKSGGGQTGLNQLSGRVWNVDVALSGNSSPPEKSLSASVVPQFARIFWD